MSSHSEIMYVARYSHVQKFSEWWA